MEFPIINKQFSTRLSTEELESLNELVSKLFPDQDWTDPTMTLRSVFVKITETADLKLNKLGQSKPEDLKKIEALKEEISFITGKCEAFDKKLQAEKAETAVNLQLIDELTTLVAETRTELSEVQDNHNQVTEKASKLEKYAPVPNEMRIIVEPLTSLVLHLYAEKIRLRNKTEVTSGEILTSLFNRYVTKRETELPGFPFLVSKQEIINLANELNNE